MNDRRWLLTSLAAGLLLLAVTPVHAHRFDVAAHFPTTASTATVDGFVREFLRAAAERDGHPGCECDGHLGGLDVYLNASRAEVDSDMQATFVVVTDEQSACGPAAAAVAASSVFIEADQALDSPETAAYRADYTRRYGTLPDDGALRGYLVARQIDAAVRPLDGVDDLVALRAALPPVCD